MADPNFNPIDRMARTLQGQNALPPRSPMASMAEQLRAGGVPPQAPPAYDAEVTQRAKAMAASRQAAGATNATAGPTQVPNGNPSVAGQQMGATNPSSVGGADPAAPNGKTSRLGAVKNFVSGAGAAEGSVGGAFKSVAQGVGGGLRAGASLLASPVAAASAAGYGAYQGFNTDTEQYAKRFGLEHTEPGLLRDVGIRALGVASDIGNGMLLGMPQTAGLFRDKAPAATAPTAAPQNPTANPTPLPAPRQNPLRAQEAAAGIEDPGRYKVAVPEGYTAPQRLRFGAASPEGTFGNGYQDLGGGFGGRSNRPDGKINEFTNIGADGRPTALSQVDTRTPEQIASGERQLAAARAYLQKGAPQISAGQQYIANMERQLGVRVGDLASKSLRNAIIMGGQQADKTEAENAAALKREEIASGDRRMGHQVQLETAALPARLQLQAAREKRAAVGEALRSSGGDLRKASSLLSEAGYTDEGKSLAEQYAAGQTAAGKDVELNRNLTAASSVVKDDKGNDVVSPARQAVNESALRQMVENYDQLSPQEKVAAEKKYRPALNILSGMNDRKNDTLFKALGWEQTPDASTLPDLNGASLTRVGPLEGAMTFGAEAGDYALNLRGGGKKYINQNRLSQAELDFLASRGLRFGDK